jgi:hypothetical protein
VSALVHRSEPPEQVFAKASVLELAAREHGWLRRRLRFGADRKRWPSTKARALAFLQLAELFILRSRARGRIDPCGRDREFFGLLEMVERMSVGLPIYTVVDGEAVALKEIKGNDDPRLQAFKRLLQIADIRRADFDNLADSIDRALRRQQRAGERALLLADQFLRKLEKSAPRPRPPTEPTQRTLRTKKGRAVKYDDYHLRAIEDRLCSVYTERDEYGALAFDDGIDGLASAMLGELDAHVPREATVDGPVSPAIRNTPARRAAMLRAACEIAVQLDVERRNAIKRKSAMLLKEFPKGAGSGHAYSARNSDLYAELVQPSQEGLDRFRGLVVRYAARVDSMSSWPAGNTKFDRALAFGLSMDVADADLAAARATLGFARLETKQEESVR